MRPPNRDGPAVAGPPKSKPAGPDSRQGSGPADGFGPFPPPTHHEAEAAVLGACMLSADACAGVVSALDPDDFDLEAHRTLFVVITAMHRAGVHVDPVLVNANLALRDKVDEVGGPGAVHDLTHPLTTPTVPAWRHYAGIVRREADRRRAIRDHLRALADLGVDVEVEV